MVCSETVFKQADMSILGGAFKSPRSNRGQEGSCRESDVLGGDCGWTNPPSRLVKGISKFELISGTNPQKYRLAISEEFGNTTSILIPVTWRQLTRNARVPLFCSCKI